jgi:hypothetical protein
MQNVPLGRRRLQRYGYGARLSVPRVPQAVSRASPRFLEHPALAVRRVRRQRQSESERAFCPERESGGTECCKLKFVSSQVCFLLFRLLGTLKTWGALKLIERRD